MKRRQNKLLFQQRPYDVLLQQGQQNQNEKQLVLLLSFFLLLFLFCDLRDVTLAPAVNSFSMSSFTFTQTHSQKYQQRFVNFPFHYMKKRRERVIQNEITSKNFKQWRNNNLALYLKNNYYDDYDHNDHNNKHHKLSKAISEIHLLLDQLYPPSDLSKRTSTSRSDGYWHYLENGQEPPKHLTYGEFDFIFFSQLLEKAFTLLQAQNGDGDVNRGDVSVDAARGRTFVDIGSGTGRLVIGAAALHPELKLSKGIEILPKLHESAMQYLSQCSETLTISPINKDDNDDNSQNDGENGDDCSIMEKELLNVQQDLDLGAKDTNYDDDNVNDNEYSEPLSNEMSNMIGALQEMTAEEWKAILGDYEMEEAEVMLDEDENGDEKEEEGKVNCISVDNEGKIADNDMNDIIDEVLQNEIGENVYSEDDKHEYQQEDLVQKFRLLEEQIHPKFILPAETELLCFDNVDVEDICDKNKKNQTDEEIENSHNNMHYFESLDDFLNMPDVQLKELFSYNDGKNQEDKSIELSEQEEVNVETCHSQDETTLYSLKRVNKDNKDRTTNDAVDDDEIQESLPLSPISFSCGSFEDPYEYFGDADLVFVFSTCWTDDMMASLGKCIGRQCKPGTIAITTEFQIPLSGEIEKVESDASLPHGEYELELLETIDGYCGVTGGVSTAYIHRVVKSLYKEGVGPRQKPVISKEEIAWKVIQAYEAKKLTDTEKFVRNTKNALAFYSFDYNLKLN